MTQMRAAQMGVTGPQPGGGNGGSFAEAPRPEPIVLDLTHDKGTFEFPPMLGSAPKVMKFWSEVEIPEEVLITTNVAYAVRREKELQDEFMVWQAKHGTVPPSSVNPKKHREMIAQFSAHCGQVFDEDRDLKYPPTIPTSWLAPLVRVAKMWHYSLGQPWQAEVEQAWLTMPGGDKWQVKELVESYRLAELAPSMIDRRRQHEVYSLIAEERGVR